MSRPGVARAAPEGRVQASLRRHALVLIWCQLGERRPTQPPSRCRRRHWTGMDWHRLARRLRAERECLRRRWQAGRGPRAERPPLQQPQPALAIWGPRATVVRLETRPKRARVDQLPASALTRPTYAVAERSLAHQRYRASVTARGRLHAPIRGGAGSAPPRGRQCVGEGSSSRARRKRALVCTLDRGEPPVRFGR